MKSSVFTYCLLLLCGTGIIVADNEPVKQRGLSQYTHEVWTATDGLPQNSITAIAQTEDGYLWLGTQDGLVRFDGVQFKVYDNHNTPQIKNNYITALHVGRSQKLWMATYEGGLISFANDSFTIVNKLKNFGNTQIRAIYMDREGGLWVAVRGKGVVRIDSTQYLTFNSTNGLVHDEARNFCQDAKGRVWIATEGGITIYDRGRLYSFTKAEGLLSNNVNVLHAAPNNKMWIGTGGGLMRVPIDLDDKNDFEIYTVDNGLPSQAVYTIFVDGKDMVWIGTRDGVARLYKKNIATFKVEDGLSYGRVQSVYVDREENVWIGTDGGGLNVLRNGLFTTYTMKQGLLSNTTWTVFEDTQHRLWIGTDGGLMCMDHDRSKFIFSYTKNNGLYDNEVYSITEDRQNNFWVTTVNGLNIIENGKVKPIEPYSLTKSITAGCAITDSKGTVWIATVGSGILKFANKKLIDIIDQQDGLPLNYVNVLQEDHQGRMWAGTDGGGVSIISGNHITTYSSINGLSNNFVQSIYHDINNVTWIGTFGGGLNRIQNDTIVSITTKQGLFNDAVFQILEDDYGRLWFTSSKGIFQATKQELNACADGTLSFIKCTAYGTEDGLKNVECNGGVQPAGWKSHNGILWFPTAEGIASVDPSVITTNRQPPMVVLEELLVDNQQVSMINNMVIEPGKERLEFRFTGLSFSNPKRVMFKAKLEGYDKEWYSVGTRRFVLYNNLPSGTYTFRVIAANSDGVWNEKGASLTLIKRAYFYETLTFLIGIILVIIIGLYAIYRYRIQSIERHQKELEFLIENRTRDLRDEQEKTERLLYESENQKTIAQKANDLKTQLLDMVAHDLKSPIISISGLTKEIQQFTDSNDRSYDYLALIQSASERMIRLISDLLNLSALESGELQFSMERVDLVVLIGMTIDGLRMQAERKGQSISYTPLVSTEEVTVNADSTRIQEVLENLISNAIKYAPSNSEIKIGLEQKNGKASFWVADSGPGFTKEDKEKIFQKFQTLSARPTGNESSTGLGLAIVKGIIDAHNGSVSVESEPGKGSKFMIELDIV